MARWRPFVCCSNSECKTWIYADKVVTLTSAPTVANIAAPIVVKKSAKGIPVVTVDGATVVATDIEASNGVIHVIDSVILPD